MTNYMDWIKNLSEAGAKQALYQLLKFPESRQFIEKCAEEWEHSYTLPEPKDGR